MAVGRYEDVNVRREILFKIEQGFSQGNLMGYLITIFVAIVMARREYISRRSRNERREKKGTVKTQNER